MYSFAFCLFIEERKKKNRKMNTQKNCTDPESNEEPLDHESCILPLHWCIRWGISTERVFLNNGDYLNYNVLILQRHRIVSHIIKLEEKLKHSLGQKCVLSYVLWISSVINSFVKGAPGIQCFLKYKVGLKLRTESLAYENGHLEITLLHSLDDIEISLRLSFEKAGISFNCKISC